MTTVAIEKVEKKKRLGFMKKVKRLAGKLPLTSEAVAMYYCMRDPVTPLWVKGTIGLSLVYFISPIDLIPDLLMFPVGYADDVAMLGAALTLTQNYINPEHKGRARAWLDS